MTLKAKMSLLLFLTSISIVSIGFSSWSITAETTAEINGNIEVDNVIDNKNMITQSGNNQVTFTKLGFLDSTGKITKKQEIIMDYTVNLDNCNEFLIKDNLAADITIKYAADANEFNMFNNSSDSTGSNTFAVSYSTNNKVSWTTLTKGTDYTVSNFECVSTLKFPSVLAEDYSSNTISFSIKYEFVVTSGKYFNETFYKTLEIEGFEFLISAMVTDY